jgi:hypothetical protein
MSSARLAMELVKVGLEIGTLLVLTLDMAGLIQ